MAKFTVNPNDFSQSQWEELYNAADLLKVELHHKAKPFKATRDAIEQAAHSCRTKAQGVLNGELGIEGNEGEWADDLTEAAGVLESYIGIGGPCVTCGKRCNVEGICPKCDRAEKIARLKDLLTQDVYTDAHEYADRVDEIRDLVAEVL